MQVLAENITLESGSNGISINAYNGGLVGIGQFNGGDISIGTAAVARNIIIGNNTNATTLYQRFGTGGLIKSQNTQISLLDADYTFLISDLLTRIIYIARVCKSDVNLTNSC